MKWISVKEQLPKYGVRVLTYAPGRYFNVAIHCLRRWDDMYGFEWLGENNSIISKDDITHWMPLPVKYEC